MPRKKANKQSQDSYNRRGNREGSIYQRKDGKWVGQVLFGYKPDGKPDRKYFYGSTREEVAKKVSDASVKAFKGEAPVKRIAITLGEYLTDWLYMFKKPEVKPRTFEWYCDISKGIIDELGKTPLKNLNTLQVQDFLISKLEKGNKSTRTVKGIRDTLNQALNHAVDTKLLEYNPVAHTKLPKREWKSETEKSKAMSIELRQKVLTAVADDDFYKPIIFTLMFTGIRAGEFLALPWKNVDLDSGVIKIDRAVTLETEMEKDFKKQSRNTVVSSTKTYNSDRKIKIPQILVEILEDWKQKQKVHKKYNFLTMPDNVVFPNQFGRLRTYNGFRTTYRRFLERYNLEHYKINLHSFRHTFATMLLEAGVNPRIVQKLLGHKDITTTLNTYSHVLDEVYDGVADTLGEICTDIIDGKFVPIIGQSKVVNLFDSQVKNVI